jgi:hypothetical protein
VSCYDLIYFKHDEKNRNDVIGHLKRQVEDLQQLLSEQKLTAQRMRAEHEDDKLSWNKQHQEHLFSVEVLYNHYLFIMLIFRNYSRHE